MRINVIISHFLNTSAKILINGPAVIGATSSVIIQKVYISPILCGYDTAVVAAMRFCANHPELRDGFYASETEPSLIAGVTPLS